MKKILDITNHQRNESKNHSEISYYYLFSVQMVVVKKTEEAKLVVHTLIPALGWTPLAT